jgi:hypothetical protein
MARLLFVAVVLFAFDAFGKVVEVPVPGGLSLEQAAPTPAGQGDLDIGGGVIRAPNGIRMAQGPRQLLLLVPLVMNAPLVARSADGRVFDVTVLADAGKSLLVEVTAAGEAPRKEGPVAGVYVLVALTVDGVSMDMALPPLRLHADGTYELGAARGRYERRPRWVVLDGHYRAWGPAEIDASGEELMFRFRRGERMVEAVLQRVEEVPERALVAGP